MSATAQSATQSATQPVIAPNQLASADDLLEQFRFLSPLRRFTRDAQGICVGVWIEAVVDLDNYMNDTPGHWQVAAALGTDGRWHQTPMMRDGSPVVLDWIPEELC